MTDSKPTPNDEAMLIDYLLGRCDDSQAKRIGGRIEREEALARLHADLRNTFSALGLAVEREPPAGLVEATMGRIRAAKRTDALLAQEQLNRQDVIRPTFSLRELTAIAGIVLLLASIFSVSYWETQRRKGVTQCTAQVQRLGSGLLTYANKNGAQLPASGVEGRRWLPTASQPAVSNSTGLFRLVKAGYVDPKAFRCPAVEGDSFVVKAGMTDFPNAKTISYSYQYSLGPEGLSIEDRRLAGVTNSLVILADSTPVFEDGRFRRDRVRSPVSTNHDGAGQTVLFMDFHAEFKRRPSVGVMGDNIYTIDGVFEYDGVEAPTSPTDTFLLPAFSGDDDTPED